MTEEAPRTIPIFDVGIAGERPSTDAGGRPRVVRGGPREKAAQIVETSVDVISKNMNSFIGGITDVLSSGARSTGEFEIDSVEVECFVSGSGQIGLAGVGLGIQGGSTLKLIFTRRKDNENV